MKYHIEGKKLETQVKGIKQKHAPPSLHPLGALGILQAQAKTNKRALKSSVHNPCVITEAEPKHESEVREIYVCVFHLK